MLRLVLAAAAGIGAAVSFEPFRLVYLLPLAIALFTLTCFDASLRRGFMLGTVFGSAFMLTLLPWLQVIGVDAWIALSLFEGLFYGLLGLGTAAVLRLHWWPAWAASLWIGVEALRGTIPFGGFPWGRLAFATVDTPVDALFAYTGSAGATLAVALVGTVLAWAVASVRRAPVRAAVGLAAACLMASAGSLFALDSPAPGEAERSVTVAAVQGDVPGQGMDAFAERRAVLDNHVSATKGLAAGVSAGDTAPPDLVIWPESSTDIDPFSDPTVFADISDAVDAIGVPVLVGAMVEGPEPSDEPSNEPSNEPSEVLNQGLVWHPVTGPGERYSKTHPVPFGEYIPFRDQLARIFTRLDQIPRDMTPGTEPGLLDMAGTPIGDVICFEVAYDELFRDLVDGGAQMIVVQTNNATYMGTGQIDQQFAIARLRAIETNRFVVVAATNGVSGIVNPRGEVVQRAPTRTQDVLVESVLLRSGVTSGIRFGVWIEVLLTAVAAVTVLCGLTVNYRRRGRPVAPLRQPKDLIERDA